MRRRGFRENGSCPARSFCCCHGRTFKDRFSAWPVTVAELSRFRSAKQSAQVIEGLENGTIDIVVGTHKLLSDKVNFARLGLVVIDEEHRFGVRQKEVLKKLRAEVDVLTLTATPIPRTLAMSYLADLDVSVIDELPAGRKPITTKLVSLTRKNEVISIINTQVKEGRQVYWGCPLIEESEKIDLTAATQTYEEISRDLPGLKIGLVHGALAPDEKQAVMQSFKNGQIDVLVATTVIEVGVDVPNATLMVIEHAERFGLAQLHQLRGRVGRGAQKSFCVLLYGELSDTGRERLKVIRETQDGFEIARRDLEIRGPGEFLGARQSGVPLLRYADLEKDDRLLEAARDFAYRWLQTDPESAQRHAKRWLSGYEEFLEA